MGMGQNWAHPTLLDISTKHSRLKSAVLKEMTHTHIIMPKLTGAERREWMGC